jgi:hypothetical protein
MTRHIRNQEPALKASIGKAGSIRKLPSCSSQAACLCRHAFVHMCAHNLALQPSRSGSCDASQEAAGSSAETVARTAAGKLTHQQNTPGNTQHMQNSTEPPTLSPQKQCGKSSITLLRQPKPRRCMAACLRGGRGGRNLTLSGRLSTPRGTVTMHASPSKSPAPVCTRTCGQAQDTPQHSTTQQRV